MHLAALENSPIRKLVLVDVGPVVPLEFLKRLGTYVGVTTRWPNFEKAVEYYSAAYKQHMSLTQEEVERVTRNSTKAIKDAEGKETGAYEALYDPAIGAPYRGEMKSDVLFWHLWDRMKCDVMVHRGELSDLLLPSHVEEMKKRGPGVKAFHEVKGVGHHPAMKTPEELKAIKEFLLS